MKQIKIMFFFVFNSSVIQGNKKFVYFWILWFFLIYIFPQNMSLILCAKFSNNLQVVRVIVCPMTAVKRNEQWRNHSNIIIKKTQLRRISILIFWLHIAYSCFEAVFLETATSFQSKRIYVLLGV